MQENNLRKLAKFSFWFGCVILAILLPASCTKKTATTAIETIGSETVVTNTAPENQYIIIGGYRTDYTKRDKTYISIVIDETRSANLSGIEQLQSTIELNISLWDKREVDFSPLKTLSYLKYLDLWGLTTVPDLSGIPSLIRLELKFGYLTNLNGIEKIRSLESLLISENYESLTDTSSLRYLRNLKSLHLYGEFYIGIDFSILRDLSELEELWLSGGGELDLAGIGHAKSIKKLHLESNVSKNTDERLREYKNIEEIGKITGLKELYLDESITSVEFLANNVNLEELRLFADNERDDYSTVKLPLDVKSLGNLKNLKLLIIRGFELENVDAVKKLPNLEVFDTALYESE